MFVVEILIILVLVTLNGLFAMSELAIVSSRRARLRQAASVGNRGAQIAMNLIADPSRFLATVQIGITLIGIFAGASSGARLAERLGTQLDRWPLIAPNGDSVAMVIVVLAITFASLIVGELVPKRIALNNPERVAVAVARPMQLLSRVASPAVWLLRLSTEAVLRLLRLEKTRSAAVSEDEVRSMIAEGARSGIFAPQEREMIEGVLRLADRPVRAIMTPRRDIIWLDKSETLDQLRARLSSLQFSHYPICEGSVDHMIGMVRAKDLWKAAPEGRGRSLSAIMTRPLAVHDNLPILRLLDLFRQEKRQVAIVVDEFGTTEGLVTLTDVLESITGEFPERDNPDDQALIKREDGSWLVDGLFPADEFEDRTGARGLKGDGSYHTMAGFVLHRLGRLPKAGDRFTYEDTVFEVVDMDGKRIDKILVTLTCQSGDFDL